MISEEKKKEKQRKTELVQPEESKDGSDSDFYSISEEIEGGGDNKDLSPSKKKPIPEKVKKTRPKDPAKLSLPKALKSKKDKNAPESKSPEKSGAKIPDSNLSDAKKYLVKEKADEDDGPLTEEVRLDMEQGLQSLKEMFKKKRHKLLESFVDKVNFKFIKAQQRSN